MSEVLKYNRLHIYLPDGYRTSNERYPVVYFFDGQNLYYDSDATFGHSMRMKDFLDGWWKKVIVVGIQCADNDDQRWRDYTPYRVQSWSRGEVNGQGDRYLRWIIHELKPEIDRSYRTIPFRECTAIVGYSLAGLTALYATLHYNEYFSKCAAISPSTLIAYGQLQYELTRRDFSSDTRLYFSWGGAEYDQGLLDRVRNETRYLEILAQKKGMRTYMYEQPGGHHGEESWREQVPVFMKFLWE